MANGAFTVWAAIFFELLDLLCEVLKVRDGANQDLKFKLLLSWFGLSFTLLWFIVFIITVLWSFVDTFVLRRYKLS